MARQCVIGDFNRFSDYRRINQTFTVARHASDEALRKGNSQGPLSKEDESRIAMLFVDFFDRIAKSVKRPTGALKNGDLLYNPLSGGQSISALSFAPLVERLGRGIVSPQMLTPNIVRTPGQENDDHATSLKRSSPFTVATERLPLDALATSSAHASVNISAIVKNIPTRVQVGHRYTAQTVGWQQTSAYVTTGIGCFATFASAYFGVFHNRALFAATPLFAMIAYSGFSSFEVTQDRTRYSAHIESMSKSAGR